MKAVLYRPSSEGSTSGPIVTAVTGSPSAISKTAAARDLVAVSIPMDNKDDWDVTHRVIDGQVVETAA